MFSAQLSGSDTKVVHTASSAQLSGLDESSIVWYAEERKRSARKELVTLVSLATDERRIIFGCDICQSQCGKEQEKGHRGAHLT